MADDFNAIDRTVDIVSAYVGNNSVSPSEVPALIKSVHIALSSTLTSGGAKSEPEAKILRPVSVKKSITPDYLICLEDGLKFKSLKRHLQTKYGLSAEAYRQKWNLPSDYPMVAPAYSASRSSMAKALGLGRKPVENPVVPVKPKRGRKAKAVAKE
ncbi:MucR family transcriptional regulator (plasmid) [Asticcacaulis sp. DW145]|uniref:MucR family transcriptional regulator n=1 Tax=Asticcacaulis sp. DW145 TaxID=3095608 RepID=UPI0030904BCE|nr:MucR family transcriptional regulator [Asticcacaulis sp. DW145]